MNILGNGTASRETEEFVSEALQQLSASNCNNDTPATIEYTIVNENGASVYSASKAAQVKYQNK